jgi:hypothetical protein
MRGRPFQPGNTYGRGRPPGSRNQSTNKVQAIFDQHGEGLATKCLYDAMQGKVTPMRIAMDRTLPVRRERALRFKIPSVKTMADVATASEAVVKAVARGRLTPSEGETFTLMLDARRRILESQEREARARGETANSKSVPDFIVERDKEAA